MVMNNNTEKEEKKITGDEQEVHENIDTDPEIERPSENRDEEKTKKKPSKRSKAKAIEELGFKLREINDKYLRISAEFDNYRKRTMKERMELAKSAGESVLVNILPVIDDFERALGSVSEAKDINAVKEGLDLIYHKFKEFLSQQGIKEIEALNEDFDTDIHEAISKIKAPVKKLKGKVVDVIEKGYLLNDKVIRYSKVVIGE